MSAADTIAAIATAAGRGGIGVVRVSGRLARHIADALGLKNLTPRHATLATFRDCEGNAIDQGVALFFSGPHSFSGEDVLELQGHGGTAVLRALLARVCELGARLAAPGEFTQRAFLNDKIDLAQAEAVADLIDAATAAAAQSAARSLVGEFSEAVNALAAKLIELRMHVEAAIDFPEEEIDPADRAWQASRVAKIAADLGALSRAARQGRLLRDGVTVALVGPPNVGKSSVLNRLVGEEIAIVTPIAGTTRDPVRAHIAIAGVPFHLVDTAGLRQTDDPIEAMGMARTRDELARASMVLVLSAWGEAETCVPLDVPARAATVRVVNKTDRASAPLTDGAATLDLATDAVYVSALTGEGFDGLRQRLLALAGARTTEEGVFMARQRHLDALALCSAHVTAAQEKLTIAHELVAEDLRMAHRALQEITGEFSPDDLLGEIFGRFCIGK